MVRQIGIAAFAIKISKALFSAVPATLDGSPYAYGSAGRDGIEAISRRVTCVCISFDLHGE